MPSKNTLSEDVQRSTKYGTINGSGSDIESGVVSSELSSVGASKPAPTNDVKTQKFIDGEAPQVYNFVPGAITDPTAPGYRYESRFFYDPNWTESFDMFLIIFMIVWLLVLLTVSWFEHHEIFSNPTRFLPFWEQQIFKAIFMSFVAFCGGCIVTQLGVKVNYTRKIQHFCAYLIPLLTNEKKGATNEYADDLLDTVIMAWWGYWFTMMTFTVFVYPIRTRLRFVDIMFASLDRPEDRPETLKWMLTQIFIGYIEISIFTTYCQAAGLYEAKQLVFIPVIITGIGDGLAEPVGYRWGKHKYRTRGLCSPKLYTRSYEGSACVFITGIIACIGCYHWFSSFLHFLLAIITIPITMTFAEAFSPHTWDTPFLMGTGFLLLWGITYVPEDMSI